MTNDCQHPPSVERKREDGAIEFAAKRLLNQPGHHSVAAISVHSRFHKEHNFCDGSISISDCGRVINLDLNVSSERSLENALYKLDTMVGVLSELRAFMEREGEAWLTTSKERKEAEERRREEMRERREHAGTRAILLEEELFGNNE